MDAEEMVRSKGFCLPAGVAFFNDKQLKKFSEALNRQNVGKSIDQINRELMHEYIHEKYNKNG